MPPESQARPAPAPRAPSPLGQALALALVTGLGAGLLSFGALVASRTLLHRSVKFSLDFAWMNPAAFVLVLVPVAVVLGPLLARLRGPRGGTLLTVLLAIAVFGLALNVQGLHPASAALLGLGVGLVASRKAVGHRLVEPPRLTRLLAGVALLAVATGGGALLWRGWVERRALAGLRPAPAAAPNVLLLVLDTQRAASMSAYGFGRPTTPELARLAGEATRFEHAFSTAPWTLPSHASIMTGRWAFQVSRGWHEPVNDTVPTLAEYFDALGYQTAGFTANTLNTSTGTGIERGFLHYEDFPASLAGILQSTRLGGWLLDRSGFKRQYLEDQLGRKTAADVRAAFGQWLAGRGGRPFFAFLNFFDAHDPYPAPPPFDSAFGVPAGRYRGNLSALEWQDWAAAEFGTQQHAYEGSIAYSDREVGRVLALLQAAGELDRTIVIVTADHGEEFMEHGVMGHGNSLYRRSLEVPLVIRYPARLAPGLVVAAPVSLRDLAATIVDLAGAPGAGPFPGRSLLRHVATPDTAGATPLFVWVQAEPTQPDHFPVAHGPLRGVVFAGYRYLVDGRGREELYALDDTLEATNRIADPAVAEVAARLRQLVVDTVR